MKKAKRVPCSDWHLGWGLGGMNKLGNLTKDDKDVYVWTGHSQGRHGQTWNKGAKLVFTYNNGEAKGFHLIDIISQKGFHPIVSELINSINELNK